MKALAAGVDLHAAVHHHGPRDQRPLRRCPGTMPLVAAQIRQPYAQLPAPCDGAAVVADMAAVDGLAHGGQMLGHHGRVAAKAVAGQQQHVAADHIHRAIGPFASDSGHAAVVVDPDVAGECSRQQHRARRGRGAFQCGHQRLACAFRQRVHAARGVTGVEKAVQHVERQAVARQRVHGRGGSAGVGSHQMRRGRAVRLGLDVGRKARGVVIDAGRALHGGTRRRNEARRQRRRPAGRGVALDQYRFNASFRQPQRGGQPASARADDEHGHMHGVRVRRGIWLALFDDGCAHPASRSRKPWQVVMSATVRKSASAASCMAGVGAAQPSASTVT